ncbi:kinase-like domain-containing protein [Tanacetum coccineum]
MSFTQAPSFSRRQSYNAPPSFTEPPSFSNKDMRYPSSYNRNVASQQIPEDLDRIPLKDIIQATNNFAGENIIEKNDDWIVYKGELSGKKLAFVLVEVNDYKTIDSCHVVMFSSLPKHQNIVSFIGCCDDYDDKVIFVLEHPTRGGLDKYVSGTQLTWLMRVKICFDIASGLHCLQNHRQTHEMKIEDLNSASIHLDENWQAMIQLIAPSALVYYNKPLSFGDLRPRLTSVGYVDISMLDKGQLGYIDPLYLQTGMQSEIYSFGVILFELLFARLAVTYDEDGGTQFLSKLVRSHYENGTLTEIIDHYNICHIPQRQIRGIPGDLSLGICFPGDLSPGIGRAEKLEGDTFPGDIVGPTQFQSNKYLPRWKVFPGDMSPGKTLK